MSKPRMKAPPVFSGGAVYHVDCDLGGDMRRASTQVQKFSTKEVGRLMTAALEAPRPTDLPADRAAVSER